jgi:hypothetical protein
LNIEKYRYLVPVVIIDGIQRLSLRFDSQELEAALRASGLPWAVLRPGRLTDGPYTSYDLNTVLRATSATRRGVTLATGDTLSPQESSRIVVAEAAVLARAYLWQCEHAR